MRVTPIFPVLGREGTVGAEGQVVQAHPLTMQDYKDLSRVPNVLTDEMVTPYSVSGLLHWVSYTESL